MLLLIRTKEFSEKIEPRYNELEEVRSARMTQGDEDEFRYTFYRLDDSVLRRFYNRHTTQESWHWVEGDDRDLFDCYYPSARRSTARVSGQFA